MTVYAQLRDAKAYFDLAARVYPDSSLDLNLPFANRSGHLTTADLLGKATVIEYWAFT
jgi:hypothetical protein